MKNIEEDNKENKQLSSQNIESKKVNKLTQLAQKEEKEQLLRIQENRKKELNLMIESLIEILDYQIQDFHSSMWNDRIKIKMQEFIENQSKVFVWIEEDKLKLSFKEFPKPDSFRKFPPKQKVQMVYFSKLDNEVLLKPDTLEENIFYRVIVLNKGISNMIEDLSATLIPEILKDQKWPDNIKKELLLSTHKFLASTTEYQSKILNKTLLYIPNENIDFFIKNFQQNSVEQKELIQRLEVVLAHWSKQIKEVLNNQSNENNSTQEGPLEEVEFWANCEENLGNIKKQLKNPKVQKILKFLRMTNSSQLKNLQQITLNIQQGAQQAEENLRFLRILEKPCRQMQGLKSGEIPAVLPRVFFCIRMLWERCPYYQSEERIANLLRKVSNQIIVRCSESISLDDLFEGNVGQCMKELGHAKECGKFWREIYERNLAVMDTSKTWKFEADSIFAQVEAFVQRCNDLQEICEGQIQFARKGSKGKISIFSGSKSGEIGLALEEIKESFEQHLQKLRGKNKLRVLDIKSTKWHDDYNAFKGGMKNLDNIYVNTISLAFEHVTTVEQAVENMIAFRLLSQREAIKIHVNKNVEKVNALALRELRAAESYAKVAPNPRLYSGNLSGRVLWYKNLLSRVKRVKWLYDKLYWVKTTFTEPVIQEHGRVESFLKLLIQNTFKEFKEQSKDIEVQLIHKLDQNILIEQGDPKNKPLVPKSMHPIVQQTLVQNRGQIECNFDKRLWCFIEELKGFQRLYAYGVPTFGGKAEEIVDAQYQKLRVFKENVMLVVREYNAILALASEREKILFREHLEKVDKAIARGIKILRWSSQGTLDNFVKDCRSKCRTLYHKIEEFQQTRKIVELKIREISSKVRLISFDVRKVHELNVFLIKQEKGREQAQTTVEKAFLEIEKILGGVYNHFISKGLGVQKMWFEFVSNFDKLLEEEFKSATRASLQHFFKTITGDEKTNTNPTQLFKIFVVMHIRDGHNSLDFDPQIDEFLEKISLMLEKTVSLFKAFRRLPIIAFESRRYKIKQLQETQAQEIQGKKPLYKKRKVEAELVEFSEEEVFGPNQPPYESIIRKDSQELILQIKRALVQHCGKLHSQLEPWKKECFLKMGSPDFGERMDRLLAQNLSVAQLGQAVGYYDNIQTEIQIEKSSDDSVCIQIDSSKIKNKLINLNYEEQKILLGKIKENAVKELRKKHKKFSDSEDTFERNPTDLEKLKDAMQLVESLSYQKSAIEESLIPLEDKFRLLDEYMMVFSDDESRLRATIGVEFEKFGKLLVDVRKRNSTFYESYQKDHLKKLESFEKDVREYKDFLLKNRPIGQEDYNEVDRSFETISEFKKGLSELRRREKDMQFGFSLFKITYLPIPELKDIEEIIERLEKFWDLRRRWEYDFEKFLPTPFRALVVNEIAELCSIIALELQDFSPKTQKWEVLRVFSEDLESVQEAAQLIGLMQASFLRERHWEIIRALFKQSFDHQSEAFSLAKILELEVQQVHEGIRTIHEEAFNEFKIEKALRKIVERWEKEELQFEELKATKETVIRGGYADHISEFLEEDLIQLSSLKTNAHAAFFSAEIETWDYELNKISEIMDLVMRVQKKFIYFNNIFLNLQEEVGQLKGDKNNFQNVKAVFLGFTKEASIEPNTRNNFTMPNFKETLQSLLSQLETIQRNMRKYLEKRRAETPRFYFLSDEDIFEILGKVKDPACLNKNVKKMFEGVQRLDFLPQGKNKSAEFLSMISSCGEIVEFKERVEVGGDLNAVVRGTEAQMRAALRLKLFESLQFTTVHNITSSKQGDKLEKWLCEFPGQVLLLSAQINWTLKTESSLMSNAKEPFRKTGSKDFWQTLKQSYTRYLQDLITVIRKQPGPLLKRKLVALITIEVHHKDLLDQLQGCTLGSFQWSQQLRFYRYTEEENALIKVRQQNGTFDYGFEYQGNSGRLVITPLTDRCYLTLTNALHYKRGGNPQGPAGTGKTETIKDLGKNLGRFVFVYNCSEGIDVKNMKDLLEGFITTGFWGCFDEFNRIEVEVLSVIAIQIGVILEAVAADHDTFDFEEKEVQLNHNCAIFVTMNPGYAGRSELPDNLKNLFRPISMMVPDSSLICRICLQAEGFKNSDLLARKVDGLYKLITQNLSRQRHYDFGLRGIKAALTLAGDFRRNNKKIEGPKLKENELFTEQRALISAVLAINEPKLVSNDLFLFETLLKDLFPEQAEATKDFDEELLQRVDRVMDRINFDKNTYFVEKLLQLHNTKDSRHGVILIGESMAGKSSLLKVLADTQREGGLSTKCFTLNPKVFSPAELYGYYDRIREENKLGVFSFLLDELCNKDDSAGEKWVLFDGPIDTKWIESMNSLLDDNKVLTLLDGNRISLRSGIKILFEVDELNQASPATVSRCGMVFLDTKEMTWLSVKIAWILEKDAVQVPDQLLDFLEDLFDKWVEPLIELKRLIPNEKVTSVSELSEVRSLTVLFDMLYKQCFATQIPVGKYEKMPELLYVNIERVFVYCVVWSLGSNLSKEGKTRFDHLIRDIEGLFPFSLQVFDYYLNLEKFEFFPWDSRLAMTPQQFRPPHGRIDGFLVETSDTLRLKYFSQALLLINQDVLLIGDSGVGKTSLIKSVLSSLDEQRFSYSLVNMTPGTSSFRLQETLESKLNRTTKKKFRPFSGKRGVIFLDNLHLPRKDEFGYRPSLELVRQFLEHHGWYDRVALDVFVEVKDLTCVAALQSGNTISVRTLNKFFLLSADLPGEKQLLRIYSSLLFNNLRDFDPEEVKPEIENAARYIVNIFKTISEEESMKPTPNKPHYLFSMKDMTRLVQGVSLVNKLNCDSRSIFLKLLVHETQRVYEDKLFAWEDIEFLHSCIQSQIEVLFGESAEAFLDSEAPVLFTHFFDARKNYALLPEIKKEEFWDESLQTFLKEQLEKYNTRESRQLRLVLFREAIVQVCKINRVLNIRGGNLLLLGNGGTGRRSLTRLSSFISGHEVFVKSSGEDKLQAFRATLKEAFERVVGRKQSLVLLLSDLDVKNELILEDINSLLSLGEIPGLFVKREGRDDFLNIKEKLRAQGGPESDEALYARFVEMISSLVHVVFCCGMDKERLRHFTRNYSGLVFNTTQIFFREWPVSALEQVSHQFLSAEGLDDPNILTSFFSMVHQKVQSQADILFEESQVKLCVTQKNFIDFLQCFKKILESKQKEVNDKVNRYSNGLLRLEEATLTVEELTSDMDLKKLDLDKKKKLSEEMCYKIREEKKKSELEKNSIEQKEAAIKKEKKKTEKLAAEAALQLEKALPALEAANEQVSQLDSQSISTIKSFLKTRDKRLELIMFSLMVLLREKPDWASVQKNVVDANFLKRLRDIDKDKITEDRIQKLEKFTQQPEVQGNLSKYSESVHILKEYVVAVEVYVKINLDVDPIRKRVQKLNDELAQKEQELLTLKRKYEENLKELNSLNDKNERMDQEYRECGEEFAELERRLGRSEQLVLGLSSSQEAWMEHKDFFLKAKERLRGDVLLSAAAVSYFGPFSIQHRQTLLREHFKPFLQKNKLKFSVNYDLVNFLAKEVEVLQWTFKGLPSDSFSIQNAVIVRHCLNWPLLVDPQAQGLNWLQQLEKENGLITMDKSKGSASQIIKKAVIDGIPLLLRDFDSKLSAEYEPLLERNIKQLGPSRFVILFGDQQISYNPQFKFYITTRFSSIRLNADLSSKLAQVNFAVKPHGLEEQALAVLLRVLDEKLENQRVECIKTKARCDETLDDLEQRILHMLQEDRGLALVDDVELIDTLLSSREKEEEIKLTIEVNKATLKKNNNTRESYRYVGFLASELYFTISQLEKVEHVYQFPLDQYLQLFEETLITLKESKTDFSDSLKDKIKKIDQAFRWSVYSATSDALFEKDRLLLAFLLAIKLAPLDQRASTEENKDATRVDFTKTQEIEEKDERQSVDYFVERFPYEYEFFVQKIKIVDRENQEMNPDIQWISQTMWDQIHELNALPGFQGILGSFMHSTREWRNVFNSAKPEEQLLPSDWSQKLTGFSLIPLIKVLRTDRVLFACRNFVQRQLGKTFIEPKNFDFEEIYQRSARQKYNAPILIILGPHLDPWPYIENLARKKQKNIIQISLGRGQVSRAKDKVLKGLQKGFWVYLGNIHLSQNFLMELQFLIDYLYSQKKNTEFQLFLSSKPITELPLTVLHASIKIAMEPSRGIQSNMFNIFNNLLPEYEPQQEDEQLEVFIQYKRLVFVLAWFHSVLNERKRFQALGWNVAYEFTDSDFIFSEKILKEQNQAHFDNPQESFQWESVRFLLSQINYGGRITDRWDQRLVDIYAQQFFTDAIVKDPDFLLAGNESSFQYKFPSENEEILYNAKLKNTANSQYFYEQFRTEIVDFIADYPQNEDPAIFGQHINAEINMQIEHSSQLVESLGILYLGKRMAFNSLENPGFDLIGFIQNIRETLPQTLDPEPFLQKILKIHRDLKLALSQPFNTVVLQETEKYNTLLGIMKENLTTIEGCLKGLSLITEETEEIVRDFILSKVPRNWSCFYLSEKSLFVWLQDLSKRVDQIRLWLEKGSLQIYWLGGLIYPSGFLTAVLQTTSRQSNIPIDNLEWDFQFLDNEANVTPVKDGAYIKGLFLEGAQWNFMQGVLEDADPMKLIYNMPIVYLKPIEKKNRIVQKQGLYECPVYICQNRAGLSERSSFLFSINLPFSNKNYDEVFWIKRGTALQLSLKN